MLRGTTPEEPWPAWPQSRGQPRLMATTGILPFERPLGSAGGQESHPRGHSPVLHLLTLSLLPVGTLQLTQGLSPAQDNDPSPETKDTSASVGRAFGLCQEAPVEPSRGKLVAHMSTAGCQALTGLQRHKNKMMEKTHAGWFNRAISVLNHENEQNKAKLPTPVTQH